MSDPQTSSSTETFRRSVRSAVDIAAPPQRVWALLTDPAGFPRWNSTVSSLQGPVALGQKLTIRVPYSPRTFTPRVSVFDPPRRMVWEDGAAPFFRGVRTFLLTPHDTGVGVEMEETLSGLMLPLAAGSLPDFVPIFSRHLADLKRAAEAAPS